MTRMIGRHSNPVGFLLATAAGTSPSLLRGAAAFVFPTIGTASLSRCGSESQRSLSFLSTSTLHYGGSSRATADRTTRPRFGGKEARQRRHCLALLSATSEPAVTGMIEDEVMTPSSQATEALLQREEQQGDRARSPPALDSEETPTKSRRRGGKARLPGPRKIGDAEEDGFSGTRLGFHVSKEYEVPEDAPNNLPEGEDEGYPMLIYQFMHAQYREDFPSQSSARKAVRRKELLLNGEEVRNDSKVNRGDTIIAQKRAQPGLFPQGKPTCTLPIVWEDDYLAVVLKPPGVAVHGGTGEGDPGPGGRRSVRQSLPYMLTPTKSTDQPLHRPLHCHRLDKPTGGLLICAKTRPALSAISDAFEQRLVHKRYTALIGGELEGSGAIVSPLDRKSCHTNYRVRGDPVRSLKTPVITTVDLWPVTGRFHQLRRHLSGIGCPILGDRRYTPEDVPLQEGGMFLQAVGLTFPHPITGEILNFSIPEPAKFGRWRDKEHRRWLEHHGRDGDNPANSDGLFGSDESPPVEEALEDAEEQERVANPMPEVEGLHVEERDGFRYYQYDWSVVGGPPSPLSLNDIDDTVEKA